MATLTGQNIRVLLQDGTKYKVVGKSTNCTVTLTGNTDDASTKDDVALASKPEITSKSWSVSVESLDVTDVAAVLNAIKNLTPFTLIWDETGTADNQSPLNTRMSRKGLAYLTDVTFQWDDRTNSTKQLQFTGSGPLTPPSEISSITPVAVNNAYTKGQFVRLFLSENNTDAPTRVIAAAKSLSLHVSTSLEDATTKDTDGDWQVQEPTALSYDISSNALVRSGEQIDSIVEAMDYARLIALYEEKLPVKFVIANTHGTNNRDMGTSICSGSVVITQLTLNAPNRQNATYDTQLTGYGIYTVAA